MVSKQIVSGLLFKKMKRFKVNREYEIVCEWKKTRNAFKHEATLLRNGIEKDNTKICYVNRTWESFEFESIVEKLLDKTGILTKRQKNNFLKRISDDSRKETDKQFGLIAGIAKLGEIFCAGDKKRENDWKTRMLKAGLENKGLIMPEDWDILDEETKEKRLNGVIKELAK
jgi:hypothetical protein